MKILLSPAKALDMSKQLNTKSTSVPSFLSESEYLVGKLSKLSAKKVGELMHLSEDLSNLNYERYQTWKPAESLGENSGLAGAIFNGEAYRGLDATNFTSKQLEVAQDKLRILSGLYGILKPLDVIYPYRLEMGTKFQITPTKSNLYKFWGDKIAEFLNEECQGAPVINVASNEYFKVINKKVLQSEVITPVFKDFKNGQLKTIMVFAKKARGAMARYIIENNLDNPEDIKSFDVDGYRFDENLTQGNNWVFTR